ncbi:hypothetical protein NDU88_003832 [Pleurodeles waltl]|uniref:Uncharacterized protein n=1 Tax=Pleurodeles waltl TaxID=8319 RepID=A0AAV7V2X4_PLEWA|nr:hypothetical protein NDU88_003832 [Pleurodeles waltl]
MWYSQVVSVLWKREWLPDEYRQENRNKNPTVSVLWKREWFPAEYRQENRNKNPTGNAPRTPRPFLWERLDTELTCRGSLTRRRLLLCFA